MRPVGLNLQLDAADLRALLDLTAFPFTVSETVHGAFRRSATGAPAATQSQLQLTLGKLRHYAVMGQPWKR